MTERRSQVTGSCFLRHGLTLRLYCHDLSLRPYLTTSRSEAPAPYVTVLRNAQAASVTSYRLLLLTSRPYVTTSRSQVPSPCVNAYALGQRKRLHRHKSQATAPHVTTLHVTTLRYDFTLRGSGSLRNGPKGGRKLLPRCDLTLRLYAQRLRLLT